MNTTWTATPQDVERLVSAVLPHSGDDAHLPMLRCVNFEADGDRLLAVATDRYTMAAAWTSLTDWHEDNQPATAGSARIYNTDLKRLFTFLRPQRKDQAVWTLTDELLTVAIDAQSIAIRTVDVEWFDWRPIFTKIVAQAQQDGGPSVLGFTPKMVEHFLASAKALGLGHVPMRWYCGPNPLRAPVIRIGDSFAGILMPVRLAQEEIALDLSAIGIASVKAVAA